MVYVQRSMFENKRNVNGGEERKKFVDLKNLAVRGSQDTDKAWERRGFSISIHLPAQMSPNQKWK